MVSHSRISLVILVHVLTISLWLSQGDVKARCWAQVRVWVRGTWLDWKVKNIIAVIAKDKDLLKLRTP